MTARPDDFDAGVVVGVLDHLTADVSGGAGVNVVGTSPPSEVVRAMPR